jgi:protein-S-isoprenylcysteine O-methyltransferase Ste14
MRPMSRFRPAREASSAWNLGKTILQTLVFWIVFVGAGPAVIVRVETALGGPAFHARGQREIGAVLFVLMAGLNLWSGVAMARLGRGTPFPLDTARELVIAGPYRFVRNPMAIGGLGVVVALGVAAGSPGIVAYALAGGILWNFVARPLEERDLVERFGERYLTYRSRVRCWIPSWPS